MKQIFLFLIANTIFFFHPQWGPARHCQKKKLTFLKIFFVFFIYLALAGGGVGRGFAQSIGNDTTITVCDSLPLINGNMDSTIIVVFPDTFYKYETILLNYSLSMPPAGWDPWDRIGNVTATKNGQTIEIARIMTPYSKACGWTVDVTDFRPVLSDTVDLTAFILYYVTVGSQKGYLVSISFDFIGGNPKKEAYKIQNLWQNTVWSRWEYGNIWTDPIQNHIPPLQVLIDPLADSVKVNVNCTGHGQGNTDNAAEFSQKTHSLRIDSTLMYSHILWRNNCGQNPCSPQSGSWQFNRAGWCPGADVVPWQVDITQNTFPGDTIWLEYIPQAYSNYCSPTNPNCVSGQTCTDCNYNSTGHTMPWYLMQSQIIYYKDLLLTTANEFHVLDLKFRVFPNPSNGEINIECNGIKNGTVEILNGLGQIVFTAQMKKEHETLNLKIANGLYMLRIREKEKTGIKKILLATE